MSLQIWLPLNGTAENHGLVGWRPTVTGATYVNGKIGKALNKGGIKMPADVTAQVLNNDAISYCCWIYVDAETGSTTNRTTIFGNDSMTAPNNRKFSIFQYPSCNDLHLSWQNETTNETFYAPRFFGVLPSYKWTHIAVTYQNPNINVYINGERITSAQGVSNSQSFAYETQCVHDSPYHRLNDIRIYNHALSPKEVKEISKGLCLHYRLSGYGNENLIKGNFSCTSTNTEYKESGTAEPTLSADDIFANRGKILTLSYDVFSLGEKQQISGSWPSFAASRFGLHGNIMFCLDGGAAAMYYPLADLLNTGKSGRYSVSWKIPENVTKVEQPLRISIQTRQSGGFACPAAGNTNTWYLKNVKLEWGNKATPLVPHSEDALYTELGYNDEPDCSGFGNDGTKNGSLAWDIETPRYTTCCDFDGKSYIAAGASAKIEDEISVCVWAYMEDWTKFKTMRLFSCTETGGWNLQQYDGDTDKFIFSVYVSGVGYKNCISSTKMSKMESGWHYFVGTYDGLQSKLYIDGKLDAELSNGQSSKTKIQYNATNGIFVGAEAGTTVDKPVGAYFSGKMSDFRIYATALSDGDILELYQNAIAVDNNGNVYMREISDDASTVSIPASGVIKAAGQNETELGYARITQTIIDGSTINEY